MTCGTFFAATQIIIALAYHERMKQVILPANRALVEMTLESFRLPWRVVSADGDLTTVIREDAHE